MSMASARTFIGIDGCRAGWFCVSLDALGNGSCCVLPDGRAVGELAETADSVLIDIPIGLPDAGPDGRQCDLEARQMLGRARAASVFPPPARSTLAASGYPEALELNRRATGRGLSKQVWNIVPKIREIDVLLHDSPVLRGVLRECHPEVCFCVLNCQQAMRYNKKTREGQRERLDVLAHYLPQCHSLLEQACTAFPRRQVARDDVIDAMACAVTARHGYGGYLTLPACPPRDGQGLAMEIVYASSAKKRF